LTLYREPDRRALAVPIHFPKTIPKGTLNDGVNEKDDAREVRGSQAASIKRKKRKMRGRGGRLSPSARLH